MQWQQSQKWASLAAIARYIMIIYSIGYLHICKTGYYFHKRIAITTNETTNYDIIFTYKICQCHLETRATNVLRSRPKRSVFE